MNIQDVVMIDPEILGGIPVFKGTRVPIKNLFDYLEAGDNVSDFLVDFDYIPKNNAMAVLKFSEILLTNKNLYEIIAGRTITD
jgi:uncharacterized protein (DUF433 family)